LVLRCSGGSSALHLIGALSLLPDSAPTEIYTLSLHDALPILAGTSLESVYVGVSGPHISSLNSSGVIAIAGAKGEIRPEDTQRVNRKSTRLNSSHVKISYAVFCLKKKKKDNSDRDRTNKAKVR